MDEDQAQMQSVPLDRRRSMGTNEDSDSCRICRGEGSPEQPLYYPCKCSGSIKYVHQECLMEWLSHSQKKYCELCKTPFHFTKLYDQSMPDKLPLPLVLRSITVHGARTVTTWFRYLVVTFIWACGLPWWIRQIWSGLFWLADGSWMSAQDLRKFAGGNNATESVDMATATANSAVAAVAATYASPETILTTGLNFSTTLMNVFSSDALLRGLLRLISHKASERVVATESTSPKVNMSLVVFSSPRGKSLLSEIHSLNSFTRYRVLNNILIDVLEGQLVCLSVIAAFILVFLIREWVINQQPVQAMPDADQPEAPAARAAGERDGEGHVRRAAGGRRRRVGVRQHREQDDQLENHALDIARRPRAIPRPRRVATEDNMIIPRGSTGMETRPDQLPRSASLTSMVTPHPVELRDHDDIMEQINTPFNLPATVDFQSPPLQRGIFDEVVDIRRSIEERTPISSSSSDSDIYAQANIVFPEFRSGPIPVVSTRPLGSPLAPARSNGDDYATSESSLHDANNVIQTADANSIEDTDPDWEVELPIMTPQDSNNNVDQEVDDDIAVEVVVETTATQEPPHPGFEPARSMTERLSIWLWHTDEYIRQSEPRPMGDDVQVVQDLDAQAPFVPVNAAAVVQRPPAANPQPPPAHEPNIQFGIDLNDPNAMDDAEDLEGIMELIGFEGPIAGMIQNIVFSMFLITLTLSASVWCPYIWGKIAFLVVSNPVGVFLKAPLYFVSKVADFLVDIMLLTTGGIGFVLTSSTKAIKALVTPLLPAFGKLLNVNAMEQYVIGLSHSSSSRLEKTLSGTIFHLQPDLPTFSMQSHHALRVYKRAFSEIVAAIGMDLFDTLDKGEQLWKSKGLLGLPLLVVQELVSMPGSSMLAVQNSIVNLRSLANDLRMPSMNDPDAIDYTLIEWNTKDRILAILTGYVFFALAGTAYLRLTHLFLDLKREEKVEGVVADALRQAGGVVKVIVIIGIEMIVFPLYCGCLLDIALLPLFKDATLRSRLVFLGNAPVTGIFVHWFLGTCYMFHFALFVSMCRKMLRKGVLYFIRDPDDPTFHPVRDVLERPVFTQLSKIAFSAGVYGGLVTLCPGVIILVLSQVIRVFPIEWTTSEPRLAFPIDLIFFNFVLPFLARKAEPSKRISAMYEWWFRLCASRLSLSQFLFGNDSEKARMPSTSPSPSHSKQAEKVAIDTATSSSEKQVQSADGTWVRAPATDSVRIPRGTKAFLEVDQNNNRLDGLPDEDKGLHGKNDDRFEIVFIPSRFKARIGIFVFLVWFFAASTGMAFTIFPLVAGRKLIRVLSGSTLAPNDLYAFAVGIHVCGGLGYIAVSIIHSGRTLQAKGQSILSSLGESLPRLLATLKYGAGLLYMSATFGIVMPILLSLLAELYVHMPIYNYMKSTSLMSTSSPNKGPMLPPSPTEAVSPTIYIVQAWILGLLYLRLLLRLSTSYPSTDSRAATAIRAITRDGFLNPDVRLASRALVLPVVAMSAILLTMPLAVAKIFILVTRASDPAYVLSVYRYSYPCILALALDYYIVVRVKDRIDGWQGKVRDEVYLVGERLHNFIDIRDEAKKMDVSSKASDKERIPAIL